MTGGLTILRPAKGQWIDPLVGDLYCERMIPVRIKCNKDTMMDIISMTLKYYKQEAIMAYKISDEVIIQRENTNESSDNGGDNDSLISIFYRD